MQQLFFAPESFLLSRWSGSSPDTLFPRSLLGTQRTPHQSTASYVAEDRRLKMITDFLTSQPQAIAPLETRPKIIKQSQTFGVGAASTGRPPYP